MTSLETNADIGIGLAQTLGGFLLLPGQWLGLGALVIARWRGPAAERLALGLGAGVFASYLLAFAVYLTGASPGWHRIAPALGLIALFFNRRALAVFFSTPEARALLSSWLLFAAWLLGWLALVRVYWGGGWMGDWVEHYQRARFFLDHAALDTRFLTQCGLTARPPLWNLVMTGWLGTTGGGFSAYQIGMTLGASLLLPGAWSVLERLGGEIRTRWLLTALLMANAAILQNAVFPWTKLPAAALVLASVPLLAEACRDGSARHLLAAAGLLAAGTLIHYSVAPCLLLAFAAFGWAQRGHWREAKLWRPAALAALTAGAVLATWLLWAVAAYGPAGAFLDNTAVSDRAGLGWGEQFLRIGGNVFRTVVPHFLRADDWKNFAQDYVWSALRDRGFLLYQTNLWFAIGSIAAPVTLWAILRDRPRPVAWLVWWSVAALLGMAAHGGADQWGLTQIGLLPLVILALVALASAWPRLPVALRRLCAFGLAVDFLWGVVLHFSLQHQEPRARFGENPGLWETVLKFGPSAFQNSLDKQRFGLVFLGDHLAFLAPLVVLGLGLIAWRVLTNLRVNPG